MTGLLPIIEQLEEAENNAERADWLLRCPIGVLDREHMTVRRLLQAAGLTAGVAYLETMKAYSSATRKPDGFSRDDVVRAVQEAAATLKSAVAAAREGA